MLSLPPLILQGGNHRKFSNRSQIGSIVSTEINNAFCDECSRELDLPVCEISTHILQEYINKSTHIREAKLLHGKDKFTSSESLKLEHKTSSVKTKESLPESISDFPFIDHSNIQPLETHSEWKRKILNVKTSKGSKRCHILPLKPKPNKKQERKTKQFPPLQISQDVSIAGDHHFQPTLLASSQVILFDNYEIGGLYRKHCKIRNVSSKKCTFTVQSAHLYPQFKVEWHPTTNILAAGMSVKLTVLFRCTSLVDIHKEFVVMVRSQAELTLNVVCSTHPPHLIELNHPASNLRTSLVDNSEMISVIDCGSLLVGEHNKVFMNFKNIGLSSRFCFIAETDWYGMRFDFDASNRLLVASGLFSIEPMYFSLNKGETIEISVSCYAISQGFHTDQVFLLSDNTAFKRIDLESDGFLFDNKWIQFVGIPKMFDVGIEDDDSTEYCIDFGIVPIASIRSYSFELHHIGCINISYHWEMRASNVPLTKSLPLPTLKITPPFGRLLHKTQEVFYLLCDTALLLPGIYRLSLVLVVDDLQEKCIPLNVHDKLLPFDCEGEDRLRSIELNTIEVMLECVKPNIILFPYDIDFSESPLILGSPQKIISVIVENKGPGAVNLTWIFENENPIVELNIDPKRIELKESSSISCSLSAKALQEGHFNTCFWCVLDTTDVGHKLQIRGTCCKGELIMLTNSIDFGIVKKGSQNLNQIIAKSCYTTKIPWALKEFNFDMSENGQLVQSDALNSLSATEGEFCHKNSEVLVKYQLDTYEDEMTCSALDWGGQYVSILADVQEADVSLSAHTLRPEFLYQEVQYTTTIFVRNHTLHHTPVFWGNPTVQQRDVINVNITPRFAILKPSQELMTEVCLIPHVVGFLENIFIPCFVEGLLQPLVLKVEGVVEGLKVRVEWKSDSKFCSVVWPPEKQLGSETEICSTSLESLLCPCPPNSYDSLAIESEPNEFHLESHTMVNPNSTNKAQSDDKDDEEFSTKSSIPYLNWPIIGGRYTRDPMSEEMERHFNNLFILEDREVHESNDHPITNNTLYFLDIPTREAISQLVYIRNDTMISSYYEAWVLNNFEESPSLDKTSLLERIKRKVRYKVDEDDFSERASKARGLTVFLEPAQGEILPHDYVTLRVTVYANSWGSYSDSVLLQLGELDQLCIRLYITVNEHPITVPSLVSFGAVFYKTIEQYRLLQLENRSTLPLVICWQMFSSETDKLPFSVMLFDGSPFELHLTPFYGSCGSHNFHLEEKYTFLEPCSSSTVKINLSPQNSRINIREGVFSEVIKAVLVGHVYLTDEANYITKAESCGREDGINLSPLQIDLEAHLQIPVLSLLNVFNYQLVFKCTSYDVMSTKQKRWQEEKVICVQNNCLIDYNAKITTLGYFQVSKIMYPCNDKKDFTLKNEISLNPGETCEVTLRCVVTQEMLYECFTEEPMIPPDTEIEAGIIEQGFINFEQEDLIQQVKLELYLYQPLLVLSTTSLNFGLVYVGDTKVLSLILTAPVSKESFETSIRSDKYDDVFSVNVSSGTLDRKTIFPLYVSFSPKVSILYKDVIVVRACLDQMFWEVPIFGVGTFNYKPHVY